MTKFFKRKFGLSDKGAKDLTKGSLACLLSNISIMFSIGLLYLLLSQTVVHLFDGQKPELNIWLYIGISVILLAFMFLSHLQQYNSTFISSYSESAKQRITLAEKLRKLPLSYFGNRDLADLTTTIMADTAGLETAFSHFVPALFGSVASTILGCIAMMFMDWRMGLALVWVVPVSFAITIFTKKIMDSANSKTKNIKMTAADGIQEYIETIKDIKSNNQSEKHLKALNKKLDKFEKSSISSELTVGVFVTSSQMILRVGIATTVIVGVALLATNQINLLMFLTFMMAATRIFDPLGGALINLAAIYNSLLQVERMKEIENYPVQNGSDNALYKGSDIVFDNVHFAYNNGETVLDGVSFTAKQGEITALVGPSGGGKSTASKLAARFLDVNSGKITLGGTDISKVEPESLLQNYSIVFQDVLLFNNTVMENIRIGRKDATDEEVLAAAKAARCDEFVLRMPDGYNMMIGENGSTLSGGERQRLSIARALLKDSPVILLDEATASLDVENETLIQDAISKLVRNKTVIVIAHRMRTVAGADKIVVLKDGKVAECGKPQELMNENGVYANMIKLQTQSANWTLK